jgi:hypothetical protein
MDFAAGGEDVHSLSSILRTSVGLGYGVTQDLTLGVNLPYVRFGDIREAHAGEPEEIHRHGNSAGFGDMILLAQYRFLKPRGNAPEMAFYFGSKFPTGKTNVRDAEGERLETEHQPGSGSWDPITGLAASKRFGNLSLDTSVLYVLATRGAQQTKLGSLFLYDTALSYRGHGRNGFTLDLIIEANGQWREKQQIGSVEDANSGESLLFLSPGTRITWKKWCASVSVGVPVMQRLGGIQNKIKTRTVFGVAFAF